MGEEHDSRRLLPVPQNAKLAPGTRRGFLGGLLAASAAGTVTLAGGSSVLAAEPALLPRVPLVKESELATGGIFEFTYPEGDAAFLARLHKAAINGVGPEQNIIAFLRACPHMGCVIGELNIDDAVLGPCGCHRGRFDVSAAGKQIIGRASQNLVQVQLEIIDGVITAVGLLGLPYGAALCREAAQ